MADFDRLITEGRAHSDYAGSTAIEAASWLMKRWPEIEAALVAARELLEAVDAYSEARPEELEGLPDWPLTGEWSRGEWIAVRAAAAVLREAMGP